MGRGTGYDSELTAAPRRGQRPRNRKAVGELEAVASMRGRIEEIYAADAAGEPADLIELALLQGAVDISEDGQLETEVYLGLIAAAVHGDPHRDGAIRAREIGLEYPLVIKDRLLTCGGMIDEIRDEIREGANDR